jgi:phosphoribosylformylglycinamidine synthase
VAQLATKAPCYERPLKSRELSSNNDELSKDCTAFIRANGFEKALQICLQDNGSHEFIFRQYDQHIGGKSALGSENGGGALLWIQHTVSEAKMPYLGLGATTACNEAYCRNNPRLGSSYAVLKAARSLAAMGVEPLAITDCLNFGNPEDPLVMWEFSESVDGISEACRQLEIAVVSGNVSLYNETDGKSIYPTPMIGMVGRCDDVRLAAPGSCQRPSQLFLLSSKMYRPGFAASSAAKGAGYPVESGQLGSIDWALERQSMAFIAEILKTKNIHAIRDIGRGGLATTVAKMTLANGLGFALFNDSQIDGETFYFGETAMGYVIACCDGIEGMAALIPPDSRLAITPIGSCHLDPTISMDGNSVNFSLLWDTYQSALDI